MQNKEISNALWQKVSGNVKDAGNISNIMDIQSSGLYRNTAAKFPATITYNLSTDGAPLSSGKSSPRSFWPLKITINDLPPNIRYKYVQLVSIMVVSKEPKPELMKLFIDQFKVEARALHEKGMKFTFKNDGIERTKTFTVLCIIADSVARAVLQFRMQFNAYMSCTYCYLMGFFLNCVKFPFIGSVSASLRTHESHMKNVFMVEKNGKPVNDVKGRSSFCDYPNVDMVKSFTLDAMHNDVLGITEQIWDLMRPKLSVFQRNEMDTMLIKIQPPHEIHRIPAKLSKKSLWKSYMLYYSIPLLHQILPTDLFHLLEHYALFVNSMYTLSTTNITAEDLQQCKEDMMSFTANVEIDYGLTAMTFNMHLGSHAVTNVKESGPLWATSAFPYEGNIFVLRRAVKGPKGAAQQMSKKSLHRTLFKLRHRKHMQELVRDFCDSCMNEKRFTAKAVSSNNINFFAPYTSKECPNDSETFLRCTYNNFILTSVKYTQNKSFNDTVVKLKNDDIVQIIDICLKNDGHGFLIVNKLNLRLLQISTVTMKHIFFVLSSPLQQFSVPITDVEAKMVVIDLGKKQCVCHIPNTWEAQ
ncbi:uncharacterized protein LOC122503051 [Leptopilina heterotoma]|uniref:uncharacterized protein LOC122503051 n=1 Tax=Leptopilina heterotoma TaxID=63436 RepID=UPI001CA9194C|nr:uncharacterized protein LOC122503051 [Leptopilina heterotoma]